MAPYSNKNIGRRKRRIPSISAGLIISIIVLFFGNNLVGQFIGESPIVMVRNFWFSKMGEEAYIEFQPEPQKSKLELLSHLAPQKCEALDDGCVVESNEYRKSAIRNVGAPRGIFIYLGVDDSFIFEETEGTNLCVVVEYYDSGDSSFGIQYDGNPPKTVGPDVDKTGRYNRATLKKNENETVEHLEGHQLWKSVAFNLINIHFGNRQVAGADLRIETDGNQIDFHKITISKGKC